MLTSLHQAGVLRESGPRTAAALRGSGPGDLHQAHAKGQPHSGAGQIIRGVSITACVTHRVTKTRTEDMLHALSSFNPRTERHHSII